jgi:hypothetical protein
VGEIDAIAGIPSANGWYEELDVDSDPEARLALKKDLAMKGVEEEELRRRRIPNRIHHRPRDMKWEGDKPVHCSNEDKITILLSAHSWGEGVMVRIALGINFTSRPKKSCLSKEFLGSNVFAPRAAKHTSSLECALVGELQTSRLKKDPTTSGDLISDGNFALCSRTHFEEKLKFESRAEQSCQ